jgi:hypothetical protein
MKRSWPEGLSRPTLPLRSSDPSFAGQKIEAHERRILARVR